MGKDKPRLGRGLTSLIGQLSQDGGADTSNASPTGDISMQGVPPVGGVSARLIHVDMIDPNPYQPRSSYNEKLLAELAASIREQGIIQPLVVRPVGTRFQLIAGQRRLEAARRADLDEVPAVIRQADDQQVLEISLVENIQREDLNCVDRAKAYRCYEEAFKIGTDRMAERLGQDRTTVTNYLRLLSLPDEVLQLLKADRMSMGHARALAGLDNVSLQIKLGVKIVQQEMSVRQAETLVARSKERGETVTKKVVEKSPNVIDLEQQMTRALSTKVTIKAARKKGSGKITIEYYSFDDFDRIMDSICGDQREEL